MLQTIFNNLQTYWQPQFERCGVVLKDNSIVELENTHSEPKNNFAMVNIPADAVALWHTHPHGCANLSVEDYHNFKNHPQYLHIIVGQREVAYYYVDTDGSVLRGDDHVS